MTPFRITKPGKYRTRSGRKFTVIPNAVTGLSGFDWQAGEDESLCWRDDGSFLIGRQSHGLDLVARLAPTPPRKPRPAKAAQFGKWIDCKSRLPDHPRGEYALGVPVLIWPRCDQTYGFAFYGKRATGKPAFYLHGAEVYNVTHWMPVPNGPKRSAK